MHNSDFSFQKVVKAFQYLIGGILFLGALLDGLSNSINLSFRFSLIGSAVLAGLWLLLAGIIIWLKQRWKDCRDSETITKPRSQINLFFCGMILLLWIPQVIAATTVREKTLDDLSLNYMRLFGSYQVPSFLSGCWIYTGNVPIDQVNHNVTVYGSEESMCDKITGINLGAVEFNQTWQQLGFEGIQPLRSRVWQELFDEFQNNYSTEELENYERLWLLAAQEDTLLSQFVEMSLNSLSCRFDSLREPKPNYCYLMEKMDQKKPGWQLDAILFPEDIAEIYEELYPDQYQENELVSRYYELSQSIGFLALILENTSNRNLLDIELSFREWINKPFGASIDSSEVIFSDQTPLQQQMLPILKSGEKILWLLSIYKKDQDGFPKNYISSITHPVSLTFRYPNDDQFYTKPIRPPLKEKAMKVILPLGWWGQ